MKAVMVHRGKTSLFLWINDLDFLLVWVPVSVATVLLLCWVSQTFPMMLLKGKKVECKFPLKPFWSPFCFKLRLCIRRGQTVQNYFQVICGRIPAILQMVSSQRNLSGSWMKTWGDSVQFFNLRETQVFLWMFSCLYNRKPFFPSDIAGLLSLLDWAQTPSMGCGGFATSQAWGMNSSCSSLYAEVCSAAFIPCVYGFLTGCGLPGQLCGVTTVLLSWLYYKGANPVAQVLVLLNKGGGRLAAVWEAGKQGLPVTAEGLV